MKENGDHQFSNDIVNPFASVEYNKTGPLKDTSSKEYQMSQPPNK